MLKRLFCAALFTASAAYGVPARGKNIAGEDEWRENLGAYRVIVSTNCPDARAKVGDTVTIRIMVASKKPGSVRITCYESGNALGDPKIRKFGKDFFEFERKAERPGTICVIGEILNEDGEPVRGARKRKLVCGLGVLVDSDRIAPGNPLPPPGFDEFWARKRAELDAVPIRAVRRQKNVPPPAAAKYPNVVCYDTQVDCAGGAPVSGYLCMPKDAKPGSLPAIVVFHGAGVRSASMMLRYGTKAIAFNVNAHGLPNGRPKKFYDDLFAGELKDYRSRHLDDHERNYFVGIYTRIMRALDYVKSLPEWDGKNLIVFGGSQGGAQALAAAGLDKQVSLCVANVPSQCDLGGRLEKRRPGGPMCRNPISIQQDAVVVRETAYVDNVFLAKNVRCPVYVSTGLIDQTCIATSVFAYYNALPPAVEKHIRVNPVGGHNGSGSVDGPKAVDAVLKLEE
jgi:cephalosporin-C deacetylase-like acetyl esterase